jgi:methyl-accepting chemotaxis protein
MFNKLSVSKRLFLGYGVILSLLILLSFIGENRVGIIDGNMKEVGQGYSLKQRYAINFRGSVHDRAISIRDAILVEDDASLTKHLGEIDVLKSFYADSANAMKSLLDKSPPSGIEQELLNAINRIETKTLALTEQVITLRKQGNNIKAKNVLLSEVSPAYSEWLKSINNFIDYQELLIQEKVGEVETVASDFRIMMMILTILAILLGIIVAIWNVRSINRPISDLMNIMLKVQKSGNFDQRVNVKTNDELGEMGKAFNDLLTTTSLAINQANQVVGAIAKGRFDQRMEVSLKGDLNTLKQGINGSADSVDFTMKELTKVMQALYNGDFSVQMDDRVEGDLRFMVQSAMVSMESNITGIIKVMDAVQQGEFNHRVEVDARGDLLQLKNVINSSMNALEGAITEIVSVVSSQSNGDLTLTVNGAYLGQLNVIKDAVNVAALKLTNVVSKAVEASVIVSSAAEEVSQGSTSLSQRVQEQAAALEQTSATMEEMNCAVQNNTQNALQTAHVTLEVQTRANKGVTVMQQTITAMNSIQESSHKIADIVALIDGIAFQTNLLALNAAVEAARAGDHGRGFAVVASEVRALAQKSAEAAKDIKGLISESVNRIDEGTKLASESGEVLKGINEAIDGVAGMVKQIAKASEEQSEGIRQVHNAIAQIDSVTQQNAALVEETTAAAESLSEQSSALEQEMSFFKVGRLGAQASLTKQG